MATNSDNISMALFCDFENVALGVRDANYDKFDIKRVLERLLLKGSIVVKKAYCDWDRYKAFKAPMHEANFEMIEIPHVRQSGKNSADIRMVVDALDLCYTKSHVNTFVIISGDSDFSPLVSKLRENAKRVIGVGVKQSTSDLLIANCDEFIFYDDLVRESQRNAARRDPRDAQPQQRRSPEEERQRREVMDARRAKCVEMAVETYDALVTDRDDGGKIWASVLKEAIKRRNPGFNEAYFGFKTFGNMLEEAQARGLLEFGRDERSGAYVARGTGVPQRTDQMNERNHVQEGMAEQEHRPEVRKEPREPRQDGRRDRHREPRHRGDRDQTSMEPQVPSRQDEAFAEDHPGVTTAAAPEPTVDKPEGRRGNRGGRGGRKPSNRNQGQATAPATDNPNSAEEQRQESAPVEAQTPQRQPRSEAALPSRDAAPESSPEVSAKPTRARKTAPAKKAPARKAAPRARPAAKKASTAGDDQA